MLNEASWLLYSWLQDVQNLTKFFDSTNCRDWSVKTNPDWMHKSYALELVSSRLQPQKREDECKPKWRCKHKKGSECFRSFFCDRNNDRLLEIHHDPKGGLDKNSNLLSHCLRVVESAALEDCKKTHNYTKDLFGFGCCGVGTSAELTYHTFWNFAWDIQTERLMAVTESHVHVVPVRLQGRRSVATRFASRLFAPIILFLSSDSASPSWNSPCADPSMSQIATRKHGL
jgi:hypothetical protein